MPRSVRLRALRDVLPVHHVAELWDSQSVVLRSEAAASAGDLECREPSVLWRLLLAEQRGEAHHHLRVRSHA